jgi:hypothetical protein
MLAPGFASTFGPQRSAPGGDREKHAEDWQGNAMGIKGGNRGVAGRAGRTLTTEDTEGTEKGLFGESDYSSG